MTPSLTVPATWRVDPGPPLVAHLAHAPGLPEITLGVGPTDEVDALVEQTDSYEVAGRPAAYRLVSHRHPDGYVLTSEWRWGEVVLRGTALPDEHAELADLFEDVAETVRF